MKFARFDVTLAALPMDGFPVEASLQIVFDAGQDRVMIQSNSREGPYYVSTEDLLRTTEMIKQLRKEKT